MKILFIIALVMLGFFPAYGSLDQMKVFLPDENALPADWQIGPIVTKEDIDIPVNNEKPDAVIRQYAVDDQNSTKRLLVTLSVFEFSSEAVSKNVHFQYESELKKQNFEELNISDNSNSGCVGFIKDKNLETEGTSISCNKGNFLIVSTAEQTGKIYESGKLISTAKVSASFAEFTLQKISSGKSTGIPEWIRNNAKWWSEGTITDNDFIQGIQFLIKEGIIQVPETEKGSGVASEIPEWVKNNAEWWAKGQIGDEDFIKGLQYLISKGIMNV